MASKGMAAAVLTMAIALVFASSAGASPQRAKHPRHLSLAIAKSRSKELAQHVCEDIDSPAPCYAVGVEGCQRLGPRKIDCGVAVRFPAEDLDCKWTVYVFYRHGELAQSEGRFQPCRATSGRDLKAVEWP